MITSNVNFEKNVDIAKYFICALKFAENFFQICKFYELLEPAQKQRQKAMNLNNFCFSNQY